MSEQTGVVKTDYVTSWTLIQAAADGSKAALDQFAQRYEQVVRNCLAARWNRSKRIALIDDAVQEVFFECIRPGGALSRVDPKHSSGFRGYLYGVMRNVMLRFETRPGPSHAELLDLPMDDATIGKLFDREYAKATVQEASQLQRKLAELSGEAAMRRVELLHARFYEEQPIRHIAKLWGVDTAWLHHEYAKARNEFLEALMRVVADSQPSATKAENEQTCKELLSLL